jgi:hypothetical protein
MGKSGKEKLILEMFFLKNLEGFSSFLSSVSSLEL